MGRALYRKYRSRDFAEIVGQSHITNILAAAVAKGNISHAYLFTGLRGSGKTSTARILAHTINKLPYSDTSHLDIIEIDAASNRRIDDIRDLRDKVHIAPTSATYKVYIIDEVHMLTAESFNALLKTLEEPPAHVVFILATTEAHKLPATIISRTQRFHFRPVPIDQVVVHLRTIATAEKITIDDAALQLIAEHGEGSFRDSISLLDQLAGSDTPITSDVVETVLGLAPTAEITTLLQAIHASDLTAATTQLRSMYAQGISAQVITDQMLQRLQTTAQESREFALMNDLIEVPRSYDVSLKLLAVVARHAAGKSPKRAALVVEVPPIPNVIEKEVIKPNPKPMPTPPVTPSNEPASTPAVERKPIDWPLVLTTLQARNAPLLSVLSRAQATQNDGTLTLQFTYSLHRKKLENGKYRNQLASLLRDVFGWCPDIVIATGAQPTDEAAIAVATIMGGGEAVNV